MIRRGLLFLVGKTAADAKTFPPGLRRPAPWDFSLLAGQRLLRLGRRAKMLLLDFDEKSLAVHLGMTGTLRVTDKSAPWDTHERWEIAFSDGLALRMRDPRRFGWVDWWREELDTWGPEPLSPDFDAESFLKAAKGRKRPLKPFLMEGKAVAGIGNIYACESLFAARLHPAAPAGLLRETHAQELVIAIKTTLEKAIDQGGSSIRDFVGASGKKGYFQMAFCVYGRAGKPCPSCATPVRQEKISGRGSFFCPRCQEMIL